MKFNKKFITNNKYTFFLSNLPSTMDYFLRA